MFLNLAFVPQMERSWAPLHNRSGLRLGKVSPVFLSVLVIFSIWISFPFSPVFISFTFRQRSTIKFHPHRIELQQPVRHIKGTFESTTATFIIFDIWDFLRDSSRLILAQDQYRPSTMNFWHWLTKSTTRKALHVGNLKFSDGLQVPKNKSNTNWWNCCKKNTKVYIFSFSPRCTWAWLRTPCGVWSHTLRSCFHTTRYFLSSISDTLWFASTLPSIF